MKKLIVLLILVIIFSLSVVTVSASYDPSTKQNIIVYRNFFGDGRDDAHPEASYPIPERVNEGARNGNAQAFASEANWNGGIFLFKNVKIEKNANQVALFYAADQRHGLVYDTNYYIYASAPGTAKDTAMSNSNQIAQIEFIKAEDSVTDMWDDWYAPENPGPKTANINLTKGTYDIYVKIEIPTAVDTYENDKDSLSPKLCDFILFNNPDISTPTEKPAETQAPAATTEVPAATTEAPAVTTEAPAVTTDVPASQDSDTEPSATQTSTEGGNDNTVLFIIIGAVILLAGAGAALYFLKIKKIKN